MDSHLQGDRAGAARPPFRPQPFRPQPFRPQPFRPQPAQAQPSETGVAGYLLGLQRTAGNASVSLMLQREPRLPTPSAASALPAQILGAQREFHQLMGEANEILRGTKFHYDYVNGIYAENFKIFQVVVGQANLEQLQNDQIADAILAGLALAAKFAPETEAASAVIKVWQLAQKIEGVASKAGKAITIAKAVAGPGGKDTDAESAGPSDPREQRLIGLEHVIDMTEAVGQFRDAGDTVLDASVSLSSDLASNAPSSGSLTPESAAALQETAADCDELLAETRRFMVTIRALRDRRKVPVPSWREVEQDIWLVYFAQKGVPHAAVVYRHMEDIGLWGPPGQPGGRLGMADEVSGPMRYEGSKVVPGGENPEKQKSEAARVVSRTDAIRTEAAALPAKWARIMLLRD